MNWCHDSNGPLFSFKIRILHNQGIAPTLGPIPHAHVGGLPQANNSNKTAFTHELSNFESNLLMKYVQYALDNAYITWNRQMIHFSMCDRKIPRVEKQVQNAVSKQSLTSSKWHHTHQPFIQHRRLGQTLQFTIE